MKAVPARVGGAGTMTHRSDRVEGGLKDVLVGSTRFFGQDRSIVSLHVDGYNSSPRSSGQPFNAFRPALSPSPNWPTLIPRSDLPKMVRGIVAAAEKV